MGSRYGLGERALLFALSFVLLSALAAAANCPDYRFNNSCNSGGCDDKGLKGKFAIPSNCPLLVGYGTSEFTLAGELPDDTEVDAKIMASKMSKVSNCCLKCKKHKKKGPCTYWQFLNLGGFRGICFIYLGGKGPECTDDVLVNTRVGGKCKIPVIKDDPHLVGAHGTQFDFSGAPDKSFCLLSDTDLHINMKMTGYLDNRTESATLLKDGKAVRTWIREVGLMWNAEGKSHSLRLVARSGKETTRGDGYLAMAVVDGKTLPRMMVGEEEVLEGGLVMKMEAVEKQGIYDVDVYSVVIGNLLDMEVRLRVANPLLQRPDDAETHISLGFNSVKTSPSIHGVLGQTYREGREERAVEFGKLVAALQHPISGDGESGKGFMDGVPSDYEASGVMKPDCKFSAFQVLESTSASLTLQ